MSEDVTSRVRSDYGKVATSGLSSDQHGVRAVAEAFGYTAEELACVPAEANMGLSCGNPTALAALKAGEVVVDLGCGGGLDVFLAARKVGPTGKAIGVDMTPEMIELARQNALRQSADGSPGNVEFHLAQIDKLPLAGDSVDCVISNCVINLVPDKPAVFREIVRVLKPGGRLAVSDIALKKDLPDELAKDITAYVGCIAGALQMNEYRQVLIEAGFAEVEVVDSRSDLNAYARAASEPVCPSPDAGSSRGPTAAACSCCAEPAAKDKQAGLTERLAGLLHRYDVNDYAASVKVFAIKPSR